MRKTVLKLVLRREAFPAKIEANPAKIVHTFALDCRMVQGRTGGRMSSLSRRKNLKEQIARLTEVRSAHSPRPCMDEASATSVLVLLREVVTCGDLCHSMVLSAFLVK